MTYAIAAVSPIEFSVYVKNWSFHSRAEAETTAAQLNGNLMPDDDFRYVVAEIM